MTCTHSSDDFLDLFFVTFHFEDVPDLQEINLFTVPQADDLIECSQELERIPEYLALFCGSTHVRDDTRKEMKRLDVLKDVRCLVSDEEDVELLQRLIDIADFRRFD